MIFSYFLHGENVGVITGFEIENASDDNWCMEEIQIRKNVDFDQFNNIIR